MTLGNIFKLQDDSSKSNIFKLLDGVVPQPLDPPKPGARMIFELPAQSFTLAHLPGK